MAPRNEPRLVLGFAVASLIAFVVVGVITLMSAVVFRGLDEPRGEAERGAPIATG